MSATTLPTTPEADDTRLLRVAMTENALFSGASGVALAAGSPWLSGWLGAPTWVLVAVGLGLVGWAAELRRTAGTVVGGRTAVAGDLGWVVGTAVLLLGWPDAMTNAGRIAAEVVAIAVAGFAAWQAVGLRRLRP